MKRLLASLALSRPGCCCAPADLNRLLALLLRCRTHMPTGCDSRYGQLLIATSSRTPDWGMRYERACSHQWWMSRHPLAGLPFSRSHRRCRSRRRHLPQGAVHHPPLLPPRPQHPARTGLAGLHQLTKSQGWFLAGCLQSKRRQVAGCAHAERHAAAVALPSTASRPRLTLSQGWAPPCIARALQRAILHGMTPLVNQMECCGTFLRSLLLLRNLAAADAHRFPANKYVSPRIRTSNDVAACNLLHGLLRCCWLLLLDACGQQQLDRAQNGSLRFVP